jgi:hypothetical protein
MDVCHVLLGRPQQYGNNIMHDRHHNVYTLSVNGKLIVVKYKREEVVFMDRPNKGNVLTFYEGKD